MHEPLEELLAHLKEAIDAAFEQAGVDTTQHRQDGDAVYH